MLLIIILVMGIIVLGKYTYIQLNRPKIHLNRPKIHLFSVTDKVQMWCYIIIIVCLIAGLIVGGLFLYEQSQPKVKWPEIPTGELPKWEWPPK